MSSAATATRPEADFPAAWPIVSVGDLAEFVNGFPFPSNSWSADSGDPIVRIQNLTDSFKPFNRYSGQLPDRYRVVEGDLLISWSATLDAFIWHGPPAWLNQHIFRVSAHTDVVDPAFLYYLMKREIRLIARSARGSTMRHVTGRIFREHKVAVPPLDEQRRIARILSTIQRSQEAVFAVMTAKTKVRSALLNRLFEPLREWPTASLGDLTLKRQYGLSTRGEPTGRLPMLRMTNLRDGSVVFENLQHVNLNDVEAAPYLVKAGDLMFNRTNSAELVGKVGLVESAIPCVFASYLIRLACDPSRILPAFLNTYLNWAPTQAILRSMATRGVSQANISASTLATLQVPVPTLEVQRRIIAITRASKKAVDGTIAEYADLGRLFASVLSAVFSEDGGG